MLQDPGRLRVPIALVRVRGDADAIRDAYSSAVASLGHHFVRQVNRLDESTNDALLRERLLVWLSSAFAAMATAVSCIGLYGLVAYVVARRTREIGIRLALGATPRSVLQSVACDGVMLAAIGVGLGIPAALAAGRFAAALLFDLSPHDPATMAVASIAFLIVALVASVVPARKAASVDPIAALRHD
jgi:putative ABC transport system permease protein